MKKINYSVELTAVGDNPLSVIKTYRDMTCLGLTDIKDMVNSVPYLLLTTTSLEEAERYKTALEKCGATVNISSSTSQEANSSNKLKKIGIGFILLNIAVIFGGAAIVAGIPHVLIEMDFFSVFLFMAIIFGFLCFLSNLSIGNNNKYTDRMVAKTIKKNAAKHHFDKAYTFNTRNATVMIDAESGRIAYISNLNPWKFQLISAKDIDNIKNDYKKGILPDTTNYVYFQFSYQGKIMKFPTFTSNHYRPLEMEKVKKGLNMAAFYAGLLSSAKISLNNEDRI